MPARIQTPRQAWIDAGLQVLADGGPDAVRVEVLAVRLGVTKGGFYGHFAGRAAFLAEVLDAWEAAATDDVITRVEIAGGTAQAKALRAGALTFSDQLVPVDLAVREWARRAPEVAARVRRVDDRRMDYLRALFGAFVDDPDEVEAASTLAFTFAIGRHLLASGHGGRSAEQVVALVARRLGLT